MNRLFTILMILASFTLFSGFTCGPHSILDTGFDLWCGDDLCAWDVTEGRVERTSTWHRSDFGAELIGNPAVISQLALEQLSCVEFVLQIDRDDSATVYIELDFQDDGSFEYSHPVAGQDFRPVHYFITPPTWYQSLRVQVRKVGAGRAVLARIEVRNGDQCFDPPIAEISDRPNGVLCEDDRQCQSGSCIEMVMWRPDVDGASMLSCGGCQTHQDCDANQACGLEYHDRDFLYQDCGEVSRHDLGERCVFDQECTTGACCGGVCAECCSDQDCPAGGQCRQMDWRILGEEYEFQILPSQCSPGQETGVAGAICMRPQDCQSLSCEGSGTLKACFLDGRRCEVGEDCPLWPTCLTIGIAGGECQ